MNDNQGEALRAAIDAAIRDTGCYVALLERPGSGEVDCGFTIGLTQAHGHPELCVFGLGEEGTLDLLDAAAELVAGGGTLAPDTETTGLIEHYPVAVREVAARNLTLFAPARQYYGDRRFRVLQLFWPDKQGRFPWHPQAHDKVRRDQPDLTA